MKKKQEKAGPKFPIVKKLHPIFAVSAKKPLFRILIDENVTPRLRDSIPSSFAAVITAQSAGLVGKKDSYLWGWAAEHGFDAIITLDTRMKRKDRDLTPIAIEAMRKVIEDEGGILDKAKLNRLPLIIHLEKRDDPAADLREIIEKFPGKLADYIRNIRKATISYIDISTAGIAPGKSWAEFAGEEYERVRRDRTRTEQLERKWKGKILSRMGAEFDKAGMAGLEKQLHAAALIVAPPSPPAQTGPSSRPS
jgi:hypothetical protein